MYYGQNNKKQITMADQEFIELLGYRDFNDIIKNNIAQEIKFENSKIHLNLSNKSIKANYSKTKFLTDSEPIEILKLSNIIETKNSVSKLQLNYEPIYLDVEKISSEIGLSIDDYKLYLDSFIDQSIIDEKKLLDGEDKAIKNLSNLALTLKIPNINILLLKIKKLPSAERTQYIDEYYTRLALLTIKKTTKKSAVVESSNIIEKDILQLDTKEDELNRRFTDLLSSVEEKPAPAKKKEESIDLDMDLDFNLDDELSLFDELPEKKSEEPQVEKEKIDDSKLSLENVKPLPIDYNPKVAADELNLPVVLIEEFVEDFIEQAHHDKDHLLASYYQKDMDNIHELGHKLKGAASNLRINELADVLEEIQFCTEHIKLKSLFIKYWGLFISLENYMKQPKL